MNKGNVLSINASPQKGTAKKPLDHAKITLTGISGDAHAGKWHRQITILSRELVDDFELTLDRAISCGEFGENLTVTDIDTSTFAIFDKIQIGEVILEVTQIGKTCHGDSCAIFREVGSCIMPKFGIFCRVLRGGEISTGAEILHMPHIFDVRIITSSDRAAAGEYEDRSGPVIVQRVSDHFLREKRKYNVSTTIIPDDAGLLRMELGRAREQNCDFVFITGGTGIGERDFSPEVVTAMADKLIPGICEFIRTKYAATKPSAMLSRSVAAVLGKTLVFAFPGSPRAVGEYLDEILPLLSHACAMLHGIDAH